MNIDQYEAKLKARSDRNSAIAYVLSMVAFAILTVLYLLADIWIDWLYVNALVGWH